MLNKFKSGRKKVPHSRVGLFKATTRFELVIRVLQTHALPLGYVAVLLSFISYYIITTYPIYVKDKNELLVCYSSRLFYVLSLISCLKLSE